MSQSNIIYRPEWTGGRYDAKSRSALYYNLIEGVSHFFKDDSAELMGALLAIPRNGQTTVEQLAADTNTAMESLVPFVEQLVRLGLLTHEPITEQGIAHYRRAMGEFNRSQMKAQVKTTQEKLPMAVTNSEMQYTERAGGVTSVMMELTYNCSEQCIHCYNIGATRNDDEVSHRADRKELQLDDYRRIIDQLYDEGLVKVCLSGGDPFSKPIAWDIIDYLYQKGIVFDIFTNGQRLQGKEERLAKYHPRLVGLSVYSGEASEHDYITRKPGSWQRTMDVARRLSELSVPMNLKCCVMRPNVKNYYRVADLAKELGAVAQFEISITDSVDGDHCASKYLRLQPEQLEIVLRDDNIPLYVGKEAPGYGGQPRPMNVNGCGAGCNSFCITPEGNLIPCCAFHAVFGNFKKESAKDILTKSEGLKQWNSLTLEQYKDCGRHDYCGYCNLCPGQNFSDNGDPTIASENNCCYMAKIRHDLAHRMMEGYDPLQGRTLQEALAALPDYAPQRIQREKHRDYSNQRLTVGG